MRFAVPDKKPLIAGLAVLGLLALMVLVSDRLAEGRAIADERARLGNLAGLVASGFERQIDKFRLVGITLAADPDVAAVLEAPSSGATPQFNARLAGLTTSLDASVIYLMDANGKTVASSNWRQPDSFLGQNYAFRAYFTNAMKRGSWEQYALGTRSKVPGLFVARRIDRDGSPLGVLVVKIRFDRLEQEWARSAGTAFVTNQDGVILVTSRPEWRFQLVAPLDRQAQRRIQDQLEFGDSPLARNAEFAAGGVLAPDQPRYSGQEFAAAGTRLANGWKVQVLARVEDSVRTARNFGRLALLAVFGLAIGGYFWVAQRRRAAVLQEQRANQLRIDDLKDRLMQANKLSTLGQIAAGVGHEINQPLAAIGLRADNARKLIGKGQLDDADATLAEVAVLTRKVGAITGELRGFARRGARQTGAVSVMAAIEGMRLLLGDRLRRDGATLSVTGGEEDLQIRGEQVRLEQVLVNLVQNALDATERGGKITVAIKAHADKVIIDVSDNGPGLPESVHASLFQPFTSSKRDGLGLGLVICQDIVGEFGGELSLIDSAQGATFRIRLDLA